MSYLNRVELIGNLGDKPTILKERDSGCFVQISLCTNKERTNKATGEVIATPNWTTVCFNGFLGKIVASHYKTGDKLFITGELKSKQWKDKDGKTHYSAYVDAKNCYKIAKLSGNKKVVADSEDVAKEAA